ncbi:HNH endonuclease family protein [Nakamurella multipartita]|uniref:GmrSD restriction endonucleases C-terminal domain-containing protein n=1 Tax=Nakamurella multipartita (strain ATCC 700099 / DSM 44233 / CIP 104796 / JCM 9543 / NBRC 105858 / Y-104) TaxID=479431 RepID=C8X8N2_NAKMY|nr:HNH endonuclease family protein [Nakamurella multipartita]ACV79087.1 hypothetical protein Namu_2741 [Nakamurella multipartita DSM 44233]
MASRRPTAGLAGSVIVVFILLSFGYFHLPGFVPLVQQAFRWTFAVSEPPQLPDAAAVGDQLAAGLLDALNEASAAETPSGASDAPSSSADTPTTDTIPAPAGGPTPEVRPGMDAAAALNTLPVAEPVLRTGYSRDQFGPAWTDENTAHLGGNQCDTRNDILGRDLTQVTYRSGSCLVATGTLHDPYTGTDIAFTRGQDTSAAVQIDHVVPLGDAWVTGAQNLSDLQRVDLANDPLNLLAVSGPINERKSDGDAATWLPPDTDYRCEYVSRQVAVKLEYALWVTPTEHDAIAGVLAGCPGQPLPGEG